MTDLDFASLTPGLVPEAERGAEDDDAREVDPWHARRAEGFGASEIAALLIGLGRREPVNVTKRIANNARIVRGTMGQPRIIAEKAGVKRPLAHSGGGEREKELLEAWAATLPDDGWLRRETVTHASIVPRELWTPTRDPHCHRLAVSLDGWCRDALGGLVVAEAKCADIEWDHMQENRAPWYWEVQVQAQLAATGCELGMLVLGRGWAYRDGPIDVWPIERDEAVIAEIRSAVVEGWERVEALKARVAEMKSAA